MTKKTKTQLLYFALNMLPVIPVSILLTAYRDNELVVNIIYYVHSVNMFAFRITRYCPFKIISKYIVHTKDLNFSKYWRRAYGDRNWLALLIYGSYTLFLFVLAILCI